MMKALITDDVHPLLLEGLKQRNYEITYNPKITFEETLDCINCFEGLVINSKIFCGEQLLEKASMLKWVARLGSGMEVIDQPACDAKGVRYFNSPEGNRDAVGEHALGLLLNLLRNITRSNNQIHHHIWQREPNRGISLNGKTVGIIGFGNTGRAFAKVLTGFDVTILAHDKYSTGFSENGITESNLDKIFDEADIISLHLPLTTETHHYADSLFFQRFRKPIFLINTSRGKVVDTEALLAACATGNILGAGLDVFENEQHQTFTTNDQNLWAKLLAEEKLLLTPHIAGWTHESKLLIAQTVLKKLDSLI
ncbi:MAG: NAD(P)-dependent oxidoreductase [Chitinophagales bacterium]